MNQNITSLTYNINQNQNQTYQPGQMNINIPAEMSSKEAGITLLQNLAQGEIFSGKITDINQNLITVALTDNIAVKATMTEALSYNIGDRAVFSVKDNLGGQIILKAVKQPNSGPVNESMKNAITAAGYTINETTVALVDNLMKQQMPIDKDTIIRYMKILDEIPGAMPKDVVMLGKMAMDIKGENIQALHDYMWSQGLEITGAVMEILDKLSLNETEMADFIKDFTDCHTETLVQEKGLSEVLNPKELNNLSEILKNTDNPKMQQLADVIIRGDITAKEFLKAAANEKCVKSLAKSMEFREIVSEFITENGHIAPEHFNKDTIKKLYTKMLQDNKSIQEKFAQNPKMSAIVNQSASNINDINFLNQLNHFMAFVQVPLKMSEQNAGGELYVYRRNKAKDVNEQIKALLHLDMDNLGALDVLVTLKDKNVTTDFKVENEEILDFIEAHMDELTRALERMGYTMKSNAALSDGKYSFENSVLEQELPPVSIKRYSFDVRA